MLDIEHLREIAGDDSRVIVSGHSAQRLRSRAIRYADMICAIMSGSIIEQYPDDYPYPSCLINGVSADGKPLHVVVGSDGEYIWIITTYYPSEDKWTDNFSVRR